MNKEKRIDYFLQLVMVIVGVFLGMLVSDWNSNRTINQDKLNLLKGLKTELQSNVNYLNSRKLKDITPFFNTLDSITRIWSKDTTFLQKHYNGDIENFSKFPGLGKAKLEDAMFEATKHSNMLSNFEIESLKHIIKAYNTQYNIEEQHYIYAERIALMNSKSTYKEVKDLMWEIMQHYFSAQYHLIEVYEASIKHIDDALKTK